MFRVPPGYVRTIRPLLKCKTFYTRGLGNPAASTRGEHGGYMLTWSGDLHFIRVASATQLGGEHGGRWICWPDLEIYISNQNAIIRDGFTHRAASQQRIESGEVLSHYSVYSLLIAANPTHCTALDSAQLTDWSHSHILCQWSSIIPSVK